MNSVDASDWMDNFVGGDNASVFAPAIEETDNLLVPVK